MMRATDSRAKSKRMALTLSKKGWKTGNKYVDFTTGLLADIGLDPTTYVGAGLAKQAGNSAVNLANPRGLAKRGAAWR